MRRATRTFLITAVAAGAALIPAAGASAGTLDQEQTLLTFGGLQVDNGNSKAQTFTAGLTGQLDQVDLALSGLSLTTPLTVQIRDGSPTTPGDTVLATTSIPASAVGGSASFASATFTTPASVTAGTQYSIVALNDSVGYFWHAGGPVTDSPYAGGRFYGVMNGTGTGPWSGGNPDADFGFRTYVAPPPPPPPSGGDPPATTTPKKKCKKKGKKRVGASKKKKCKKKRKK